MKHLFIGIIFAALFFAAPCAAQTAGFSASSDEPLEITADQTLEWHRNDKQYIARGNATAKQGDVSIEADILTADYREGKASSMDIYRLTATEGVMISSRGGTATGEKAVYDVDSGVAVMTGNNLRLTSPGQTVTARDSFEYRVTEGRLTAIGNAQAVRETEGKTSRINSDRLSAVFTEDPKTRQRVLQTLEAVGNVVITTPEETLSGDRGKYDAASNIAVITGNVRITRGPNVLEGESADVNLATNVSAIHGGKGGGGRVRGVFYPESAKKMKAERDAAPVPAPVMQAPVQADPSVQQFPLDGPAPSSPSGFRPMITAP